MGIVLFLEFLGAGASRAAKQHFFKQRVLLTEQADSGLKMFDLVLVILLHVVEYAVTLMLSTRRLLAGALAGLDHRYFIQY